MKANEFVKKHGLAKARKLVQGYPNTTTYKFYDYCFDSSSGEYVSVSLAELKRLVESHELVGGDLEYAKKFYADCAFKRDKHLVRYKQAIADVESCL